MKENLLRLVNEARAERGIHPLCLSPILDKSADFKARDMAFGASTYGPYFAHTSPAGETPEHLKVRFGYPPKSPGWGENIAWGNEKGEDTFVQLWDSPPHRDNFLNKVYTEIGIGGPITSSKYRSVWAIQFGNAKTCPQAVASNIRYVWKTPAWVRIAPAFNQRAFGFLQPNEEVYLIDSSMHKVPLDNDGFLWYPVQTRHGWGWMDGRVLSKDKIVPEPPPAEGIILSLISERDNIPVHSAPESTSNVITTLPLGTAVLFTGGPVGEWLPITSEKGAGWTRSEYWKTTDASRRKKDVPVLEHFYPGNP